MKLKIAAWVSVWILSFIAQGAAFAQATTSPLSKKKAAAAADDYQQYCALCHGADREGYANDHAPSLRSRALIAPGHSLLLFRATAYGRPGTAMAAYREESGGPMSNGEIDHLVRWLYQEAGADPNYDENENRVRLTYDRVAGDVVRGGEIYARECAQCHGAGGEGGTGTALGNSVMLVFTPDLFLRDAIANGRDGTEMAGFKGRLSATEIDDVTAFLRSRAAGWHVAQPLRGRPPSPDEYVINPDGPDPAFDLKDGLYVSAADLHEALASGARLTLLDTRVASWWQMGHIEGAIPVPYYSDFDAVAENLPGDGAWIVAYCECPRAAAESVVRKLRARGFKKTAVLWEGIQGWAALGYGVILGDIETVDARSAE